MCRKKFTLFARASQYTLSRMMGSPSSSIHTDHLCISHSIYSKARHTLGTIIHFCLFQSLIDRLYIIFQFVSLKHYCTTALHCSGCRIGITLPVDQHHPRTSGWRCNFLSIRRRPLRKERARRRND